MEAKSPMIAVSRPVKPKDTKKHNQPPKMLGGGTRENTTCNTSKDIRMAFM